MSYEFKELIFVLDNIIETTFDYIIKPKLDRLYNKYTDNLFRSKGSNIEFSNIIKNGTKKIKDSLSQKYIMLLEDTLYSAEGIVFIILGKLNYLSREYLKNL